MKTQLALAAGFAGLLAARPALPCGAPFGNGINVNPQQDIIVAHKDGVETYVFQPTFCRTATSTATNFGLILPVPATLTASPALSDQQAFTTVVSLSLPTYVTLTSCSPYGGGRGGIAPGNGGSGVDAGATVVSSGRVGFLDWVQLKADTEKSFTDWLTTNGYSYSTAASSVFSYYVQKGWYFVAFRISQGATPDGGSSTGCNALGSVKLSFASPVPVVPSRMASAGSATTSYGSGFSWRIFGITPGDQQLAFSDGANYNRVLGYSGALTAADIPSLAGLAAAGDRLTKLTLTFSYASTDPDVGLSLASATDYREIIHTTQYVYCPDAGTATPVDAIPVSPDAGTPDALFIPVPDASGGLDVPFIPDAEPAVDTSAPVVADARINPDTAPQVVPDAGTTPDAPPALASADAASSATSARPAAYAGGGSGCSVAGTSTSGGLLALALLGLALACRVRGRRRVMAPLSRNPHSRS
jgi:MYXO-CTERM domain-containing protein